MEIPWWNQLPHRLQHFLIGSASSITSGVISGIVLQFLNAIGRRAARKFQSSDGKRALEAAMTCALERTAQSAAPDQQKRFHFMKLFTAWLEREAVVDELSQLIDPRAHSNIDLHLLEREFTLLGFAARRLQQELRFSDAALAFMHHFRNALAEQAALQNRISIGHLDQLVRATEQLIDEERRQTRLLKKIERHVAAVTLTPDWQNYLHRQVVQYEYLSFLGLDPKAADAEGSMTQRLRMSGVYIQLNTTAKHDSRQDDISAQRYYPDSRPVTVIEALDGQSNIVLLGGPGSGKSTFVNHLNYCLARHHLEPQNGWLQHLPQWPTAFSDLIPVPIVLRQLAAWLKSTSTHLRQSALCMAYLKHHLKQMAFDGLYEPIRAKLDSGEALLLLDGLDEVPADTDLCAAIVAMIDDLSFIQTPKLVTCRVLSYQDQRWQLKNDRWKVVELDRLNDAQIGHFIGAWYEQVAQHGAIDPVQKRDKLQAAVHREDLVELARNPLMLTVMAIVHTHKGELPDSRTVLYEDVIELLLCRWEAQKNKHPGPLDTDFWHLLKTVGLQSIDFKKALWELAYGVHAQLSPGPEKKLDADIADVQLHHTLKKLHPEQSLDWANAMLGIMKLRAGLLVETKPNNYAFVHRTFQEYMAGCHLATSVDFSDQALALADRGAFWWDVILLAVGRLIHHMGEIDRPLLLVSELCPHHALQLDDMAAWRRVLLAGKVLAEIGVARAGRRRIGADVMETVRRHLVALISKELFSPRERSDAADSLALLGDPRPGVGCTDTLPDIQWLTVCGGPFTMGSSIEADQHALEWEMPQFLCHRLVADYEVSRYPITVAQYSAFVQGGGYGQKRFWTADGWQWRRQHNLVRPKGYMAVYQLPNHPQVGVSWYEAVAFCHWFTEKSGMVVTLPTEAQWERAARHTDGRIYPWGRRFKPGCCNTTAAGIGSTAAVGIFPGSDTVCGAADMSGNVFEWSRTIHRKNYRDYDQKVVDDLAAQGPRVLRGGCWYDSRDDARCAVRLRFNPFDRGPNIGFRCVRLS